MNNAVKTDTAIYQHLRIGYLGPRVILALQIKIVSGIRKMADKYGITLFHFGGPFPGDTKENISHSKFIYELMSTQKINGLIGWSSQLCNEDGFLFDLEGFLDQHPEFPAVFIGKPVLDYPTVIVDNFPGMHELMNHLIHVHNYRKIAFIRGSAIHPYLEERYKAYLLALEKNNIAFNPRFVYSVARISPESGTEAVYHFLDHRQLKPGKDIQAIVTVSDMLSLGVINELKKRNIRVPRDIAVVGFNNKNESLSSSPTITTVDINFEGMGQKSMELLLSMLNGEERSGIFRTSTKLVIRQSCGCLYAGMKIKKRAGHNPISEDIDAKQDFLTKLVRQEANIITQMNKKFINSSYIDHQWCTALLMGLRKTIKEGSPHFFLQVIEEILNQIAEKKLNIFLWNQYLFQFRETVLELVVDTSLKSWVEMLFYYAISLLSQQIERETVYNQLQLFEYDYRNEILFQSIVSTYELGELLEILAAELPRFGIEACYFALFHNPAGPLKQAALKLAYNAGGVHNLSGNKALFEADQLIPDKYYQKMDKIFYIILPLYFQDTPIGFFIIGVSVLSEFRCMIYDVLCRLVSSSLQGAGDVRKLKTAQALLEKKAAEQRLSVLEANAANLAKSRFLRNMSHEIRTPLNCIMGFLEVIGDENNINQINEYLDIIKNESGKLMELINQLLDLSKIEAGKLEIKNARFNIIKTVQNIHSVFSKSARQQGLDYTTQISKAMPVYLIGDALRLRQVIVNLVGNAIKFTHKGGIAVTAAVQKETSTEIRLYFEITDTGIGISRENQAVIFDTFMQVEDRVNRKFNGSGLGTAISKQLVNMMGGEIGVRSQPGKGSTFWFTIQCKKCSQAAEVPAVPGKAAQLTGDDEQGLQRASILLVDDYPANRKVADIHLKKLGCRVDYAENGRIAVDKCSHAAYDLILMDMQMPEMDGLEATKRIRELPGGRYVPIIAITAAAYEDDIKTMKANDLDDVITKPFKKQEFTATVIYWLIRRKNKSE